MSNVELLAGIILFLLALVVIFWVGAWLLSVVEDLFDALFGLIALLFGLFTLPFRRHRQRSSCNCADCTPEVCVPECRYYSELRPRETKEHRLRREVLQGRIDWQKKYPHLSNKPCLCGQVWQAERDIRIVNSNRDPKSIEPKFCPYCWQLLDKNSDQKLADAPWIAW